MPPPSERSEKGDGDFHQPVIPAQAGIQSFQGLRIPWIPHRNDDTRPFYIGDWNLFGARNLIIGI
jgi:hypothetical protein